MSISISWSNFRPPDQTFDFLQNANFDLLKFDLLIISFSLQVDTNDLTLSQSDTLEKIDFDLKLLVTKELIDILKIGKDQVH
jgi:hypothetical protein